jgi:3-oxoacyl-[acyl-carrier protein] reductase
MQVLENKVALVTGASRGIGAGIARELAAAGAMVFVNFASGKDAAAKVVADIVAAGGRAEAVQGDFSREDEIARVYAHIASHVKGLDILVNSAGVFRFFPIEELTGAEFHRQYDLNVLGLMLSVKHALPLLTHAGGNVINIGSMAGSMPAAMASVYGATKAAVDAITISLSKELGPRGIRVNSLNPGLVETEGTVAEGIIGSEFHDFAMASTPLRRVGTPQDIGRAAVLLASSQAGWITGQTLIAAGGLTV